MEQATIIIESLGGYAPVQAEGRVNGLPFYWRSRHEHYSLSVAADPGGDPLHVHEEGGYYRRYRYGSGHAASWLPPRTARRLLLRTLADYLYAEDYPEEGSDVRPQEL